MGIQVLGPLAVDGSGRFGPRDRAVLLALAVRQGGSVTADELVDAVWGAQPPASAHKNLQSCVVRLRKALGPDAIDTTQDGYRLAVPADDLDAAQFEAQVNRARDLLALGEADRVVFQLERALALWRGPAFADLADWAPARREAGRLEELRMDAEELLLDAELRRGHSRKVLPRAHDMVRTAPLRERRWELLALAQYRTGAQGEALRSIRRLRAVLARELGIDPSPEIVALEESILRQDPSLLAPSPRRADARCPWPGLRAYDVDDADRFFGRERDVAACSSVLARGGFLAIVGPSGSGKSSLLRAGVLSSLRQRGHDAVLITPGPRPLDALSSLPSDAPGSTVLAVDQAEETWTMCEDLDERQAFLEKLTVEAERRLVVLAVRGDRLTRATEHPAFGRLVEQGLHLVGALDEDGLREAVERPAEQAGLMIEPGLVDLLVREVRDDPGALPLLSHALLETWRRREGNTLTVDGYRASGGIRGAVAQSAEALYAATEPDQRRRLRDLMLRLVSPAADGDAVRTRVPRRLLAGDPEHDRLIDSLVAARLVTSDEDVLEITHEALARAWPRLRGWLEDDVEGQRIRHHLSGAADAWDGLGRPDSELYRGVRLTRALDWASSTDTMLTDTEREFLHTARQQAEAEERSAADQARAQARLIRRLRIVLAGAAALLVMALVAGGLAAVQSDRASDSATRAQQAAVAALARGAASRGAATGNLDQSLLLAAAGVVLDESPETVAALQAVISEHPALIRSFPSRGRKAVALDIVPRSRTAAVLDRRHAVTLVHLDSGAKLARRQLGTRRSELEERRVLRASPDGRLIAAGAAAYSGQLLHLLDAGTLQPAAQQPTGLPRGDWRIIEAAFSRDSSTLVAVVNRLTERGDSRAPDRTRAYVWTRGHWARPQMIDLTRWTPVWATVALSPDGNLLYTATPTVRVHDLRTSEVRTLSERNADDPFAGIDEVALDVTPDGRTLVVTGGSYANNGVLLDAETGRLRHTLPQDGRTYDARFSGDGRRVLTVEWRPTVVTVWDAGTGARITRFTIPVSNSRAVDVDQGGEMVVSASESDQSLRKWDVDGRSRYLQREAMTGLPWPGNDEADDNACNTTTSEDGAYVAYTMCSDPTQSLVMDVARRRAHPVQSTEQGYHFGGGSWHAPRAEYLRAVGGTLYAWDGRTGRNRAVAHPVGDRVSEIDHSPDGTRVVVSELSGTITLLDSTTLEPVGQPVNLGANVCCVALGPDNRTAFALVGGPERTNFWNDEVERWALVDLQAGKVLRKGPLGLGNGAWAAYSPDGKHVAASGQGGEVAIIETATGKLVRKPVQAHSELTPWVSFSPDGSQAVSAAMDGTVVIWDVPTGQIAGRVNIGGMGSAPVFLPDGRILIPPWGADPAVYLWDPSTARAVAFVCQAAGRDLTHDEWGEHFGTVPQREICPPSPS